MMKRLALLVILAVACSPRGELTVAPDAAAVGSVQRIYVGTNRVADASANGFGEARSETVSFGRYDISVPPIREPGQISWPRRTAQPDPQTDFVTTEIARFPDAPAFRRDLARNLRTSPDRNEAVIFVHGFNNTFAEGLYRFAQLNHDLGSGSTAVHFAWPSAASPLGYVYDRDSALFARDALETLIREVAASGSKRIVLTAHSLGAGLTMETLRQIALKGDRALLRRVSGVVLISPDVDVDVFRAQAHAIGDLPQPFVIFSNTRDRALGFLSMLNGTPERLGNIEDVSRLADLRITLLDTDAFSTGAGHFTAGDSPALLRILDQLNAVNDAFEGDGRGKTGLLPGVVLTVQNATQIILAPVATALAP